MGRIFEMAPRFAWDEENTAEAARLWKAGHSASQIAKALGIPTRNAVIGKIHRMGLSRGTVQRKNIAAANNKHRSFIAHAAKVPREPKPKPKAKPKLIIAGNGAVIEKPEGKPSPYEGVKLTAWEPLPGVEPLPLLRLSLMSCRWPVEIADSDDHHFCGAMKINGPYCLHHARLGRSKVQPAPKSVERLAKRYAA